MKKPDQTKLGRREFLRTMGAGLAVASAAPLATGAVAEENDGEKKKARYKETDHVKTFYKVNRY